MLRAIAGIARGKQSLGRADAGGSFDFVANGSCRIPPHRRIPPSIEKDTGLVYAADLLIAARLAIALALDFFVVLSLATHERTLSLGIAASVFWRLMALWFAFPFRERRERFGHHATTHSPAGR